MIRKATQADARGIWAIFEPIARAGETYTYARDITREDALNAWLTTPLRTYVVEENDRILGTYMLRVNQTGGGKHVVNCGYMVADMARGRGLASKMCVHSQNIARSLGFKAMQFNFVVSTNTGAIKLWQKLGFDIVGTLPRAFDHPTAGLVDAHIMYKWLDS